MAMAEEDDPAAQWNRFVTDVTRRLSDLEARVRTLEKAPRDQLNQIQLDSMQVKLQAWRKWLLEWAADLEVQLGIKVARVGPLPELDRVEEEHVAAPAPVAQAAAPKSTHVVTDNPIGPTGLVGDGKKKSRLTTPVVVAISAGVLSFGVLLGLAILRHWIPGIP